MFFTRQIAPQIATPRNDLPWRTWDVTPTILRQSGLPFSTDFFHQEKMKNSTPHHVAPKQTKKNVWVKKSRNSLHGAVYHKTACFRLKERQALKGLVIWRISGNFSELIEKIHLCPSSPSQLPTPKKARQKTWEIIFCSFVSISVKWRSTLKPKELKMKSYISNKGISCPKLWEHHPPPPTHPPN